MGKRRILYLYKNLGLVLVSSSVVVVIQMGITEISAHAVSVEKLTTASGLEQAMHARAR